MILQRLKWCYCCKVPFMLQLCIVNSACRGLRQKALMTKPTFCLVWCSPNNILYLESVLIPGYYFFIDTYSLDVTTLQNILGGLSFEYRTLGYLHYLRWLSSFIRDLTVI